VIPIKYFLMPNSNFPTQQNVRYNCVLLFSISTRDSRREYWHKSLQGVRGHTPPRKILKFWTAKGRNFEYFLWMKALLGFKKFILAPYTRVWYGSRILMNNRCLIIWSINTSFQSEEEHDSVFPAISWT